MTYLSAPLLPLHSWHAIDRRRALGLGFGGLALSVLSPDRTFAQRRGEGPAEVPLDELMKQGDLKDMVLGSAEAKVTIVEYASMTCGHCAQFHNKVFPELKTKYIDTGKVRFVMREYPLDHLAAAASMLGRCIGGDKSYPLVTALFARQEEWAFVRGNPVPKLFETVKQAGFTQEAFDKCLTDQKLLDQLTAQRTRASEKFGVTSTPTFFVNGRRLTGGYQMSDFDKALEPLLKSS